MPQLAPSQWRHPSTATQGLAGRSKGLMPATQEKHSAFLHNYKPSTERLELLDSEKKTIIIESQPFASGGVCKAYRMWCLNQDGERGPLLVAKKYKFKEGTQGFREDHVNWYTASLLVKPFNDLLASCCPTSPAVQLLPLCRLMEVRGEWYSVEDYLPGTFRKYNNIFGDVESPPMKGEDTTFFDLAAAFSHFSYCQTDHDHVILDVQGVDATYTDCAVVSQTQSKYGFTDTGPRGIQNFLRKHTCNDLCLKLGLQTGGRPISSGRRVVREQPRLLSPKTARLVPRSFARSTRVYTLIDPDATVPGCPAPDHGRQAFPSVTRLSPTPTLSSMSIGLSATPLAWEYSNPWDPNGLTVAP